MGGRNHNSQLSGFHNSQMKNNFLQASINFSCSTWQNKFYCFAAHIIELTCLSQRKALNPCNFTSHIFENNHITCYHKQTKKRICFIISLCKRYYFDSFKCPHLKNRKKCYMFSSKSYHCWSANHETRTEIQFYSDEYKLSRSILHVILAILNEPWHSLYMEIEYL